MLKSIILWALFAVMTLGAYQFGFYALTIWDEQNHKAATDVNLGAGFFDMWFAAYHRSDALKYWMFVAHVAPAGVVFLIAPLQFFKPLRSRVPWLHRWLGRFAMVSVIASIGAVFGLLPSSKMGINCVWSSIVFGSMTVFHAVRAWLTARDKQWQAHRRAAIRMWALLFGVFYMRVLIGIVKDNFYPSDAWQHDAVAKELFTFEFYFGWVTSVIFAEFYIWLTAAPSSPAPAPAKQD
jgi:Predicted membrane protein (DUF2306)